MLTDRASSSGPDEGQAAKNLTETSSPLRRFSNRHLLALTVLVVAVCLFRWPLLSGLYTFVDTGPDVAQMTIPDLEFRAHALREGSVPIWSNYQHGGQAFLGELLPNVLNPFSYALLALPLKHGHISISAFLDYFVLLQCLAAISAYFLLSDLGCSRWASVLGGLFYAIGGPPGNSTWIEFVTELIYTPLVLLFLFRSLRGQRPLANCAVAGAITGVCWFSGTHHFALITSITCFATLLAFSIRREWKLGLLRAAVYSIVLSLVAAPQLLPSLEYSRLSMRWVGLTNPVMGSRKVPYAAHLIEFFRPSHLLDIPFGLDLAYWGGGMAFAGVVALSFAPFAVRSLAGTRFLRLIAAFAVAGVLLSMSAWNTLYGIAYFLVPGFDKLRECMTWIVLSHLAWTCLLGIGLTRFFFGGDIELRRKMSRVYFIVGPAFLVAAYVLAFIAKPEWRDIPDRLGITGLVVSLVALVMLLADRGLVKPAVCVCLLGGIMMIEHGNVSGQSTLRFLPRDGESEKRYTAPVAADDEIARFLKTRSDVVRIDVNVPDVPESFGEMHGIEAMNGHGASMLTSLLQLPYWHPKARQLYGVNYFVARQPADSGQQLLYTAGNGIKVFSNQGARPRVWTVHKAIPVGNWDEVHAVMGDPGFDVAEATFLDKKDGVPTLVDCPPSGDQVRLLERTNWHVKIQATLGCKGMVILSDNFYPGWRGYVDGNRAPILPAYKSIRGVVVDAGVHIVEMRYVPWGFYLGIVLFVIGLAGTIVLWKRDEGPGEDLLG
jgi:hypothetical protein